MLARFLLPDDFGLFGIALLVLNVLEEFSQTGFNAALIQKTGDIGPYLDTVWTIQIIRGAGLTVLALGAAPLAALFFQEPQVRPLLYGLAIGPLLLGFTNSAVVNFDRDLSFEKKYILEAASAMLSLIAAIVAVIVLGTVWALVISRLARSVIKPIMSYIVHAYRPRFRLNLAQAKELYGFGRWIFATKFLQFFILQGDDAFVGRVLGAAPLGLYQVAFRFSEKLTREAEHSVTDVIFPALSKLQHDQDRLRRAYLRSLQLIALLLFPLVGLIVVLASELVKTILGQQWIDVVPTMQVLAVVGIVKHLGSFGHLFKSVGQPRVTTYESLVRLAFMVLLIYPLTRLLGITGTALSVGMATLIARIPTFFKALDVIGASPLTFFKAIAVPLLAAGGAMGALLLARHVMPSIGATRLVALIIFGTMVYSASVYVLDAATGANIRRSFKSLIQSVIPSDAPRSP